MFRMPSSVSERFTYGVKWEILDYFIETDRLKTANSERRILFSGIISIIIAAKHKTQVPDPCHLSLQRKSLKRETVNERKILLDLEYEVQKMLRGSIVVQLWEEGRGAFYVVSVFKVQSVSVHLCFHVF